MQLNLNLPNLQTSTTADTYSSLIFHHFKGAQPTQSAQTDNS